MAFAFCQLHGVPVMCGPHGLKGEPDHLFHNNGDGTFTDVSVKAGVSDPGDYYGFTAIFVDVNNDGKVDLLVANDSEPNYLYINKGDGTFEDQSYVSGFALNKDGREIASMGLAVGDYLNNGLVDLLVTDFSEDFKALYRNDGDASFTDVADQAGIAQMAVPFLGWGAGFPDFDNDGWKDIMTINGHVYPEVDQHDWGTTFNQRAASVSQYARRQICLRAAGQGLRAGHADLGARRGVWRPLQQRQDRRGHQPHRRPGGTAQERESGRASLGGVEAGGRREEPARRGGRDRVFDCQRHEATRRRDEWRQLHFIERSAAALWAGRCDRCRQRGDSLALRRARDGEAPRRRSHLHRHGRPRHHGRPVRAAAVRRCNPCCGKAPEALSAKPAPLYDAAVDARWQFLLRCMLMALAAAVPASAQHYVEHEFTIPWAMAAPGLDALLVYVDLPGKHPLAVITHGSSRSREEHALVTPWQELPQALWFARRGWVALVVVRRGYGVSGGEEDGTRAGRCPQTDYEGAARYGAEDLRIAIDFARGLPQVDATRIVAAGVSTGGMATTALTAKAPPGLAAAINFAGGRGSKADHDVCNPADLVDAYKDFGKTSRTPMLWLYAENDKFFWPELARKFDAAFRSKGGQDQFVLAPAIGSDGHSLFRHVDAWSATVDAFLDAQHLAPLKELLPAAKAPDVPPPPGLSETGMAAFESYLLMGPHRAFATSEHSFGLSAANMSVEDARRKALEQCKRAAPKSETCTVVYVDESAVRR